MNLRPYQTELVTATRKALHKHKRVILCAPTGAGKTVMFTYIAENATKKGNRCVVLTDRLTLKDQVERYGVDVLTAQTVTSRDIECQWDVVIVDEAHEGIFTKVLERWDPQYVIGATATPTGKHLKRLYKDIVQCVTVPQLQREGFLASCIGKQRNEVKGLKSARGEYTEASQFAAMDKPRIYDGVVEDWFSELQGKRTLVYAVNIEHAEKLAEKFGDVARVVHSRVKDPQEIIKAHKRGEFPVLINVGMLTKGYDDPEVEAIMIVRATRSIALWHQMLGRGGRVTDTKRVFYAYDYGGNFARLGRWDAEIVWAFEDDKGGVGAAPVKMCKHCDGVNYASATVCECCGEAFPVRVQEPVETVLEDVPLAERKLLSRMSVGELIQRENMGVVKKQYVWRVLSWRPKVEVEEYRKRRGYAWAWTHRWFGKKLVFYDKMC